MLLIVLFRLETNVHSSLDQNYHYIILIFYLNFNCLVNLEMAGYGLYMAGPDTRV